MKKMLLILSTFLLLATPSFAVISTSVGNNTPSALSPIEKRGKFYYLNGQKIKSPSEFKTIIVKANDVEANRLAKQGTDLLLFGSIGLVVLLVVGGLILIILGRSKLSKAIKRYNAVVSGTN